MAQNEKLPKLNIMILGKTGVGKSTLINSLFGENLAVTGFGRPVTQDIRKFETEDCPISYLRYSRYGTGWTAFGREFVERYHQAYS